MEKKHMSGDQSAIDKLADLSLANIGDSPKVR